MELYEKKILLPFWNSPKIKAGFTLPELGNLALTRQSVSKKTSTVENRQELCILLGIDSTRMFIPYQQHGNNAIVVTSEMERHNGFMSLNDALQCDALLTCEKNLYLMITWADCVPIIFYDRKIGICGVVHSGWRSTAKEIWFEVCNKLQEMGSDINSLFVAIGPAIKGCCYQIGEDCASQLEKLPERDEIKKENGLIYIDLSRVVYKQIVRSGVADRNIDYAPYCTACSHSPSFFSCRKDGANFEAQGAFIGMISQ